MAERIMVLQIGGPDLSSMYRLPENITWRYYSHLSAEKVPEEDGVRENGRGERLRNGGLPKGCPDPDVCILGVVDPQILPVVAQSTEPYTVFYLDGFPEESEAGQKFIHARAAKKLYLQDTEAMQHFCNMLPGYFFRRPYGAKLSWYPETDEKLISYEGNLGSSSVRDFGPQFRPYYAWQETIPLAAGQPLEIWLEYSTEGSVAVELVIREYRSGSIAELVNTWTVSGSSLARPYTVEDDKGGGYLSFGLRVRGRGALTVGALHYRKSRCGMGEFLAGGERHAADDRQEFFTYFHPANLRPPLCVYFSGYRTQEGFEGFYMMKGFGAPFLLFTDPRLEGGAFYLGTPSFEQMIEDVIRKTLANLGFGSDQLIMSGISMGSVGALYYGSLLQPHAVIAGKPIPNIGSIAENERLVRPGGFPTSLDVLRMCTGGTSHDDAMALNARVWERIDAADWSHSEIAMSYMKQDDYDPHGYQDLLRHLRGRKVRIYGKGIEGRHNDNTTAVNLWFQEQYRRILRDDYGRS